MQHEGAKMKLKEKYNYLNSFTKVRFLLFSNINKKFCAAELMFGLVEFGIDLRGEGRLSGDPNFYLPSKSISDPV
jgi:hypothetical protein